MATDPLDGAAREAVRTERRRVVDEREAFETFRRRVGNIAPGSAPAAGRRVLVGASASTSADAVRDAYRATVMSVPHYDEEYDDCLDASLGAEFGPDVTAALDSGFDARTKRALVTATESAREDRVRFVAALDTEADSLADARVAAEAVLDEVESLAAEARDATDYGTLDALRARLKVVESRCDETAAERQAHLRERHDDLGLPDDFPDFGHYLYADCAGPYPVLAAFADLGDLVRRTRRRVERRLLAAD